MIFVPQRGRDHDGNLFWVLILMASIAVAAAMFAGCATSGLDTARKSITASLHVMMDGADALDSADKAVKDDIAAQVKSGKLTVDQAETKFDAWVAKRARCTTAIMALFDALKSASHAVDIAASVKSTNYAAVMAELVTALAEASQALTAAGIHVGGL